MTKLVCVPRILTPERAEVALRRSLEINPANAQLSILAQVSGRYRMAIDNSCSLAQLRLFANGFEG